MRRTIWVTAMRQVAAQRKILRRQDIGTVVPMSFEKKAREPKRAFQLATELFFPYPALLARTPPLGSYYPLQDPNHRCSIFPSMRITPSNPVRGSMRLRAWFRSP